MVHILNGDFADRACVLCVPLRTPLCVRVCACVCVRVRACVSECVCVCCCLVFPKCPCRVPLNIVDRTVCLPHHPVATCPRLCTTLLIASVRDAQRSIQPAVGMISN